MDLGVLTVLAGRWLRRVEPQAFAWSAEAVRAGAIVLGAGAAIGLATLWHVHTTLRYPGANLDTAVVAVLGA